MKNNVEFEISISINFITFLKFSELIGEMLLQLQQTLELSEASRVNARTKYWYVYKDAMKRVPFYELGEKASSDV